MILMKQLEAKKRSDERERKREDMRLKSEREREKRMEQKRLEVEVITEMRKPIEDMSLDDQETQFLAPQSTCSWSKRPDLQF